MTELILVMRNDTNWNGLCDVARRSFQNWHPSPLSDANREYYGLKKEGRIVGSVTVDAASGCANLYDLAIDPDWRRKHLGLDMLGQLDDRLCDRFRLAWLITEPKNLEFYETAGFVRDPHSNSMFMIQMIKEYG